MSAPRDSIVGQLLPGKGLILKQFSIGIFSALLVLFFLVTGGLWFVEKWVVWEGVFMVYMFFIIVSLLFARQALATPAFVWLLTFAISAIGGFFLFRALFGGFTLDLNFPKGSLLLLVPFSYVVAFAEESVFRGMLLSIGSSRVGAGVLLSSLAFSIWHVAAYAGFGLIAFFTAFVMGMAFGFIYLATRKWAGISIVVGLHMAWNLALLLG